MSYKSKELCLDLCIIYENDATEWASHFKRQFENADTNSHLIKFEDALPIPSKHITKWMEDAKAIMIILSENMVDNLVKNKGINFSSCIKDIKKAVLLFLSVSEDDLDSFDLKPQFPDYNSPLWTKLSYGEGSSIDDLESIITNVLDLIDKNTLIIEAASPKDQFKNLLQNTLIRGPAPSAPSQDVYLPMNQVTPLKEEPQDDYLDMKQFRKPNDYTDGTEPTDAYDTHNFPDQSTQNEDGDVYDINMDVLKTKGKQDSYDICNKDGQEDLSYEIHEFVRSRTVAEEQVKVTAVPAVISCESETEVCLCFKEKLKNYKDCKMELEIQNSDDASDTFEVNQVEMINPYTFKFKSDLSACHDSCQTEKKARILVFVNDENIAVCNVEYVSMTRKIDGVNHILLQLLDVMCSTIKKSNAELLSKVDAKFRQDFMLPETTIETSAFEDLFGMYTFCNIENSKEEIPTILHLAAKYGFKELSAKLIDLPGANLANSITNHQHKLPSDLAKDNDHVDLANMIDTFAEMGQESMYDLYVKMQWDDGYLQPKGNSSQVPYYNKSSRGDIAGALYYSDSTKTTSRFPTTPTQLVYDDVDKPSYMDMTGIRKLNLKPQPIPPKKAMAPTHDIFDQDVYTDADQVLPIDWANTSNCDEDTNDDIQSRTVPRHHGTVFDKLSSSQSFKIPKEQSAVFRRTKSEDCYLHCAIQEPGFVCLDDELESLQQESNTDQNTEDMLTDNYESDNGDNSLKRPKNPFHIQSIKSNGPKVFSPELEELASIQKKVAEGELTIDDARCLYFEWQRKHPTDNSFKGKQEKMKKLREKKNQQDALQSNSTANTRPDVKTKLPKTKVKQKKGQEIVSKGNQTKLYVRHLDIKRPVVTETSPNEVYDDVNDEPVFKRNSVDSNGSSRDSRGSVVDSGNGSGLEPEDNNSPDVPKRNYSRRRNKDSNITQTSRNSRSEMFKENAKSSFPQLPPKLPPKGLHQAVRLGKPALVAPLSPDKPPATFKKK